MKEPKNKTKIKQPVSGNKIAKVPVVMQLEFLECGAASLAMVLAYYNKWIPLEQVRKDCGVSRDGSNAKNILLAAQNYGLNTKAYRLEPEDLKESGIFPCIIHWEFNHFVVLDGFRGKYAIINDPARGTVKVPMNVFDESFTGVCLFFEPSKEFVPSGKPKSILGFARNRLIGAGSAIAIVMITSLIGCIMGIIMPVMSRIFIDRLLTGRNPDWSMPFIAFLAVLSVIQIIVELISTLASLKINGKLAVVGNSTYLWKVLHLPMEFFSQRMAGDIQNRQNENAEVASALVETFGPLLLDSVMVIFYLTVLLKINVFLTAVGILSVVINLFMSNIISKKRINITRVMMRDSGKLASASVAGIEMIDSIKASGAENGFFEKWAGYQASVNSAQVEYSKINSYLGAIPGLVNVFLDIVVLVGGVYLIIQGQFESGLLYSFQAFLTSFTSPCMELISGGQTIQEMRTSMERIEDVMNYPEDDCFLEETEETEKSEVSEEKSYSKISGNIEIKDLVFGYSKLSSPLISDFNLSVKPGSKIAIVGASGCGKSTVSKLISGLYKPWSGQILFDGKSIEEIDKNVFKGSLAVVDQDIILYEDTIENNIKMWDTSIQDFEIILAARDASIHEDIMRREGGYKYKIIEGGKDFSGGQRQRFEIARVLAQDPTIVILDEATSALDAKTEYEVVKSIKERGITCLIIAHRLSTIRDCDEIIVLNKGQIVGRGTHEQLVENNEFYKNLVYSE